MSSWKSKATIQAGNSKNGKIEPFLLSLCCLGMEMAGASYKNPRKSPSETKTLSFANTSRISQIFHAISQQFSWNLILSCSGCVCLEQSTHLVLSAPYLKLVLTYQLFRLNVSRTCEQTGSTKVCLSCFRYLLILSYVCKDRWLSKTLYAQLAVSMTSGDASVYDFCPWRNMSGLAPCCFECFLRWKRGGFQAFLGWV